MENVKRLGVPVTIAVSAGVARFVFSDQRSFYSFLRGVFIAAFVGLLGGYALQDVTMGEGARGLVIGVTSFCADEVLMSVIKVARWVKADPINRARDIVAILFRR